MEIFDFGLRLRELREKKRLSQQQLADWLGLTRSSISNYENNTQTPPADTLVRLADIYGVSVDYLLGVKNDRKRVLVIEGLTPSGGGIPGGQQQIHPTLTGECRLPLGFSAGKGRRPTFFPLLLWAFLDGLRIL